MRGSPPPPDAAAAAAELVTIRDFLRWAVSRFSEAGLSYGHGTTNALDEAAFMILECLNLPIDQLEPYLDARLTIAERQIVAETLAARVTTRKPASYLLGRAYIQGVPFTVDERVIVPRSLIGELLADDALFGPGGTLTPEPDAVFRVLDLCTGSGCLAILAAFRFPNAAIDAVDISDDALTVARWNVKDHGLTDRITLLAGDLFAPVQGRSYDLILANPPYVPADDIDALPPEYRHEPVMALEGGPDGLDLVETILAGAPAHLAPGGRLVCEIGDGRAAFETAFPALEVLWLETDSGSDQVFAVSAGDLSAQNAE